MNFGAGLFCNLGKDASWIVKFLGYISPFRYACERALRCLLDGTSYTKLVCDYLSYTFEEKCFPIMITFLIGFFIIAWGATVIKA